MILIAVLVGGLGIAGMIYKRTFLGVLIGVQLFFLGATLALVRVGWLVRAPLQGQLFGVFIVIGALAQLVTGFALVVRFFYLRKSVDFSEMKLLKN